MPPVDRTAILHAITQLTHIDARKRYVRDREAPHAQITLAPAYG